LDERKVYLLTNLNLLTEGGNVSSKVIQNIIC